MLCRPEMTGADWAPWLARQERALSNRATVLVSDAQVPAAPEETRECDFLSMAARRLAQVGSAAAKRSLPVEPYEDSLFCVRDLVAGPGNLQAWINRQFYGIAPDVAEVPFHGFDAVERMAQRYSDALNIYDDAVFGGRPPPAAASSPAPPTVAAAVVPRGALVVGRKAQASPPSNPLPSSWDIGNIVHGAIQSHYRHDHPQHCVMTEVRVTGPCVGESGGTLRPLTRMSGDPELSVWGFALGKSLRGQFRPDIVDLTTREVWEIKSRSEILVGLAELYGTYIVPANAIIGDYNATHYGAEALRGYGPGTSWHPFSLYPVGPSMVAWVHSEIPGLIYYDVVAVSPFAIPHYSQEPLPVRQRSQLQRVARPHEADRSRWWDVLTLAGGAFVVIAMTTPVGEVAVGVAVLVAI